MPLTFNDAVLGELTYDQELEWWAGKVTLDTEEGELFLWAEPTLPNDQAALEALRTALERLKAHNTQIRRQTAEKLLELAEEWRGEDENPEMLTLERFTKLISLESVELNTNQGATIYYADGDLFAGHVILAEVDENGEVVEASIAG